MHWFKRWLGLKPKLPDLLITYPPYEIPYPGGGCEIDPMERAFLPSTHLDYKHITPEQAQANLDYLLTHKQVRIDIFACLLKHFDVDVHTGLEANNPKPFLDQLHLWVYTQWPSVYSKKLADPQRWWDSPKHGEDIVYSMITDMAIVLGELVIRHHPDFYWDLNRNPKDKAMANYLRPVIMRKPPGASYALNAAEIADFENSMRGRYDRVTSPGSDVDRPISEEILELINLPPFPLE